MKARPIEFVVIGVVAGGDSGLLRVIGRCGAEPIRLGDRFHSLIRLRPRKYPDELGMADERQEEKAVSIDVKQIQAYCEEMDELGQGMTGALGLTGQGIELVESGWILGQPIQAAIGR